MDTLNLPLNEKNKTIATRWMLAAAIFGVAMLVVDHNARPGNEWIVLIIFMLFTALFGLVPCTKSFSISEESIKQTSFNLYGYEKQHVIAVADASVAKTNQYTRGGTSLMFFQNKKLKFSLDLGDVGSDNLQLVQDKVRALGIPHTGF